MQLRRPDPELERVIGDYTNVLLELEGCLRGFARAYERTVSIEAIADYLYQQGLTTRQVESVRRRLTGREVLDAYVLGWLVSVGVPIETNVTASRTRISGRVKRDSREAMEFALQILESVRRHRDTRISK
jgi:hypothetical protein